MLMFKKFLDWRKEKNVDDIRENFQLTELIEVKKLYPHGYHKTDKDATAMCLKEDYYSGLGSNMHAGYNAQLIVSKGMILTYYVGQERNDLHEFIPTIEEFYKTFGKFPSNLLMSCNKL